MCWRFDHNPMPAQPLRYVVVVVDDLPAYLQTYGPSHYAILGVFGQFTLEIKPERENTPKDNNKTVTITILAKAPP